MKKILYLALSALLLVACGEKQKEQPESKTLTLTVSPASLSFGAEDASAKLINVSTNGSWVAVPAGNWTHLVDKNSGSGNASVTVKVDAQEEQMGRSANILFIANLSGQEKQASVMVSQDGNTKPAVVEIVPKPAEFDGNKRASTTYQLLIYSFADSNGDGVGDFKGIENHLDYLDGLGATALWLSPAHPTNSYHGYDVNDYFALNPLFGTENEFKSLIDAAHAKGIQIYMDYVLNHTGAGHPWFRSACDSPESEYNQYYVISSNPDADVKARAVDNYAGQDTAGMGSWFPILNSGISGQRLHFKLDWTGSQKKVTVTKTDEAAQSSNSDAGVQKYVYFGNDKLYRLYETSTNIFEITVDFVSDWGFLLRTSGSSWDTGTKYGGKLGAGVVKLGEPYTLAVSTKDYDPGNLVVEGRCYFGAFGSSMPDINYGKYSSCEESPAFQDLASTADYWIAMGVDGFRLDAVVWVYQRNHEASIRFLDQWYQHCNSTYHEVGHSDNIFMVGEAWYGNHSNPEKQYYKGLPSNFEFDYGYAVRDMLKSGNASGFASKVAGFVTDHTAQRPDAITSLFLSNHDEDRFASDLGGNVAKEKQAGAILLSGPGKPFIYQGEELGYWGTKQNGDEYVRAPIMWDKAGNQIARKGVNNKVDSNMLKADISVEAQQANDDSILKVYQTWSRLRNTYPALATGEMTAASLSGSSIASWYMTAGSQKLLVIHNVAASEKKVTVTDSMEKPVGLLGTASYAGTELTLGPNSSVVFEL